MMENYKEYLKLIAAFCTHEMALLYSDLTEDDLVHIRNKIGDKKVDNDIAKAQNKIQRDINVALAEKIEMGDLDTLKFVAKNSELIKGYRPVSRVAVHTSNDRSHLLQKKSEIKPAAPVERNRLLKTVLDEEND